MNYLTNNNASDVAWGYKQASFPVQTTDGVMFIQEDVCPQPGDAILDLGCGTGELSAYLAELVGPKGKVIGVDPDKERIQLARRTHTEVKNLSFVEGNASNFLEIVPEAFDIVFSNYVLHWIPDKREAFENMFQCLKIGGKIAVQYISHLPPFELNAYKQLNPENAEQILNMYQCEPKVSIEEFCSSARFEIIKSYNTQCVKLAFENVTTLLEWHWSSTHGVFDPSLVNKQRLETYLAPYTDKYGKVCLDFQGMKEEAPICRLVACKELMVDP